ncbi:hypothetical protein [Tepidibacter sp. Z1-5]|uniref:hypothetical protein n=1 Tax=Tepidibacter sp. Z1-5 TaxID=3134138 RepID=UPI0030BE1901
MQISINYNFINTLEDLRLLSKSYKKGLIMKPNITKLAKALNGFTPSKTRNKSRKNNQKQQSSNLL